MPEPPAPEPGSEERPPPARPVRSGSRTDGTDESRPSVRALHERLYRRDATEADVAAYLAASTPRSNEAGIPTRVSRASITRRGLVVAIGLGSVAVAFSTSPLLGSIGSRRTGDRTTTPAVPVLTANPLLDGSGQRRARAALEDVPLRGTQPLIALIGSALPTLRSSGFAVLAGQGVGFVDLPLGPFGVTSAGRGVQVVVVTLHGRYGWELTGRTSAGGPRILFRAGAAGPGVVSSAGGPVPARATDLAIRFELPREEPFVYYLLATG